MSDGDPPRRPPPSTWPTTGELLGLAALQIMHVLQRDAPAARCDQLHVTTANHRADAHAAYRALGFADTGRRFAKPL